MFGAPVKYPEGRNDRLWFYISDSEGEFMKQKLVVDGLGVTATVREPDIGATNGIIHVIDKVLGIPSSTIKQKLSEDPMLRLLFYINPSKYKVFDNIFVDPKHCNFTYYRNFFELISSTYSLGAQNHFNAMLEKTDSKYTYLVPSNEAWKNLQGKMASTWKVLFHGDFGYQVSRHAW